MCEYAHQHQTPSKLPEFVLVTSRPADPNGMSRRRTLRCIAERLLPQGHEQTYLQKELVKEKALVFPAATKSYHIYCSLKNTGALELLQEFADNHGLTLELTPSGPAPSERRSKTQRKSKTMQNTALHVTQDIEKLGECDFMLVYLTAQTWTRADASSMFALEVRRAMDADVPLLLAHEMIGVGGQEARYGCEFARFFSCDDGATPPDLIERGIHAKIAVALKGGEWRKTSMAMLAKALAGSNVIGKEDAEELKRTQKMSKGAQQALRMHTSTSTTARRRAAASTAANILCQIRYRLSLLRPSSLERTLRERQGGSIPIEKAATSNSLVVESSV